MNGWLTAIALSGYAAAGVALLTRRLPGVRRDLWWALLALVAVSAAFELATLLEKTGITGALDPLEDLLRVVQPATWGALLYIWQQVAAARERDRRESLLDAALEGGRLGVWEWDIATGHVRWHGLTEQIFDMASGAFDNTVEAVRERVHPDDREAMWADVQRALEQGTPYLSRYRLRLPGGEVRWIEATGTVHRDGQDQPRRMVGTVRDISGARQAELELRHSEERYRDFTAIAADWVWEMGPDLRMRAISERIEELTGIAPAVLVGRTRAEIGDFSQDPAALERHLAVLEARREFRDFRYRARLADGSIRWFETSGRPLFGEDGTFQGYRGTAREITAEVETLEALRESEERFRNLIEGSIQGIYVHRDFKPLFVNRAFAQMLGYASPEAMLALPSIESWIAPEDLARMRRYSEARHAGAPDVPAMYEYHAVRRDGSRIVLQNFVRTVSWQGRAAVQCAVVDVTERTAVEERLRGEKRFTDRVIDSLPGVFYLFDAKSRFLRWNRNLETVTGYSSQEIAAISYIDFFEGDERSYIAGQIAKVFEEGSATAEANLVFKDRTQRPYFLTGHRVETDAGACLVGMGIDIGERKAAEAALRASEARYRALYDDNPSTYVTLDEQGTIRSINRHGAGQLGYDAAALQGTDARTLYTDPAQASFERFLAECLAQPGVLQRWELPKRCADGTVLWVRETARAVHDADGQVLVLVVSEDVSEARDLSERLAYEATHDGLTDLINRREFENRLERVLETARASDSEHALCYLDLDQFKIVNDTCGHMAGDQLLRQLGNVLKGSVRHRDTLARLGGDEFALLIEHCPMSKAVRIANTLREAVESHRFQWDDYSFKVGASIGVVPIDAASPGAAHLLGMADHACYAAKEQGRNRVHVYREDDAEIARRSGEMQWVARLDAALEAGRFTLVRQRIAPVDGAFEGDHYELLLRMMEEDGTLISPGAFLPAAERYNVAVRVDRWVLDAALDWLEGEPGELDGLHLCAINLSGHSLTDEAFLDHAVGRIRASRVPPEKLCFEITETAAIVNFAGAHAFITALRELGCRFALDDFGSGLSSFGYLKTLPVDYLKIDGTFVKDIVDDPIDRAMVEAINRIGQVIGKKTVAEFVESEAILARLREIGVDYAQGYHVGHPEPLVSAARGVALARQAG